MARKGDVTIFLRVRDAGAAALASTKAKLAKWAGDVRGYFMSVNGALAGLTAGLTAASVTAFVVRSTMEFQKFSAQLKVFTGSSHNAARAMEDLKQLAMDLPFDLAQITESFITLRSGGIEPTEQLMRALGDIASGAGKDILTLAQAVKNGTMGEMEMLKQFGISMLVEGDKLKASFGGTTERIGRDAASVVAWMERLARTDFAGAAAERMNTLEGKFSNLADKAWNLAVVIGTKGGVVEALGEAADGASKLADQLERNEAVVTHWSRILVASAQYAGSVIWTLLVTPWEAVLTTVSLVGAAVLQVMASTMQMFQLVGKAVTFVSGNDTLERFLSPDFLQGQANAWANFAVRSSERGANQIDALGQRLANLAIAAEGEVIGQGGTVGPGKSKPTAGAAADPKALEDYNERQRAIAAARTKREEREAGARRPAEEPVLLKNRLDRAAGVEDLMRGIRPSTEPGRDAADQAAAAKALADEIRKTISEIDVLALKGPSMAAQFGAALHATANDALTLEQQLLQIGTSGVQTFVDGFTGAFEQIRHGWDAVGQAMVNAVRGAVAQMAADQSRYYGTKAIAALGEALLNPLGAAKSLAAAAKFTAASAAFAALSGVAGSAGGGGIAASIGGGGGSGTRQSTRLEDARGEGIIYLQGSNLFDLGDPKAQDQFQAMIEKLSGRRVEIRRR